MRKFVTVLTLHLILIKQVTEIDEKLEVVVLNRYIFSYKNTHITQEIISAQVILTNFLSFYESSIILTLTQLCRVLTKRFMFSWKIEIKIKVIA